jgi:hypothetical protein
MGAPPTRPPWIRGTWPWFDRIDRKASILRGHDVIPGLPEGGPAFVPSMNILIKVMSIVSLIAVPACVAVRPF